MSRREIHRHKPRRAQGGLCLRISRRLGPAQSAGGGTRVAFHVSRPAKLRAPSPSPELLLDLSVKGVRKIDLIIGEGCP